MWAGLYCLALRFSFIERIQLDLPGKARGREDWRAGRGGGGAGRDGADARPVSGRRLGRWATFVVSCSSGEIAGTSYGLRRICVFCPGERWGGLE